METSSLLTNPSHVIQLAVAPVFLLAGIGAILSVLSTRLGRIVDRARVLEDSRLEAPNDLRTSIDQELAILSKRAKLVHWSITLCTTCALLICTVIMILFVGSFLDLNIGFLIALLFILSMIALIVALTIFLKEIFLATSSLRIGVGKSA